MISGVHKVVLAVRDCDEAKAFWIDKMGFALGKDEAYGEGQRWLEVVAPDQAITLVLSGAESTHPTDRAIKDELPHSYVFFYAEDVEQTYRELVERGVNFPVPPSKQFWGWWSMFEDQDGTRYALGQRTA